MVHNRETVTGASAVPTRSEIAQALERMAASAIFCKAERCLRLLRYITGEALDGRESELKEYTLGVAALGRPDSFDPRTDPIVRLEVRRLRLKLAEYYQQAAADDPVMIELPKGAYVPQFRYRRTELPAVEGVKGTRIARKWKLGVATALVAASVAAAGFAFSRLPRNNAAHGSVAVLAFRDNSPGQTLTYFADGLRDGLTSTLVRTKGLDVTARVSSGQASEGRESLVEIARRLQADTVVSGSVSPSGASIQVVVGLVSARTGKYLWSKTYQATTADLPLIEHSAASGIAEALGAKSDAPVPSLPGNAEASEAYLRARSMARTRLPAQMREASQLFERAIRLQPDYAPAYAAAASNYLVGAQNGVMAWREVGARGMDLARKAVDLDPTLADGYSALGAGWQAQWKWQEADAEIARSIELDPNSPIPHFRRAFTLTILRRFAEAEREIDTARALDPSWAAAHGLLGEIYFYERRYEDALDLAKRFHAAEPEFFDNLTARVWVAQGKLELARPLLAGAGTAYGRALGRAIGGDTQGAYRDLLAARSSGGATAYELAEYGAEGLHDRKVALEWLERSFEDHDPDLVSLALDPMFDGIRGDARAAAILGKMNLGREPGPKLAKVN